MSPKRIAASLSGTIVALAVGLSLTSVPQAAIAHQHGGPSSPAHRHTHRHAPDFPDLRTRAFIPPTIPDVQIGGAAIGHRVGGRSTVKTASRGVAYSTGYLAAEPTLGVTKDGSIFYVALDPSRGQQWPVLRSDDGGRSWTDVSPVVGPSHRHPAGFDPMLYVDKDTDRVFSADFMFGCSPVSFSDDEGALWLPGSACSLADHQNLFTGPPATSTTIGYPNVVYYCSIDAGALAAYGTATSCLKSLDGGVNFVRTGAPAFTDDPTAGQGSEGMFGVPGHCGGATGHGFADENGVVYLPRGYCGQPFLAISHDEGATWTRVQVAKNGFPALDDNSLHEHEAAVAADGKGNVFYFYMAKDRLPYLVVSRDGGEKWGRPQMIAPPGLKEANLPTMDIDDQGRLALAYVGSTNAPGGKAPDGEGNEYGKVTWNGYIATIDAPLAKRPKVRTAAVNPPGDPLVRGNCGIVRCQQVFDFIDVVLDRKGQPWAAMVDGCAPKAKEPGLCSSLGMGIVATIER